MSLPSLWPLVTQQVDSWHREMGRRKFLSTLLLFGVTPVLRPGRSRFLVRVARSLIPIDALAQSGVDLAANLEHLLSRASGEHRRRILRLLTWSQRVSFLYGGDQIAIRAARSRFALMQKLARALASLCLVAFWGDPRTAVLLDRPEGFK